MLRVDLRRLEVKQVHSTPPSKPPLHVYVKILSVLLVLTNQKCVQSSLTEGSRQLDVHLSDSFCGFPFALGGDLWGWERTEHLEQQVVAH